MSPEQGLTPEQLALIESRIEWHREHRNIHANVLAADAERLLREVVRLTGVDLDRAREGLDAKAYAVPFDEALRRLLAAGPDDIEQ